MQSISLQIPKTDGVNLPILFESRVEIFKTYS